LGPSLNPVCKDAYFFSHVHIALIGAVQESLTIDLERKTFSDRPTAFSVGTPSLTRETIPYDSGNLSHVSIPVRWGLGSKNMCLYVNYIRNPQVRNGLSLQGDNMPHGSGLLLRNYRPKLFRLPSLYSVETVVLPRNLKRVTSNRGTSGHREYNMSLVV
jgi:hypothetical protein